MLQEWNQSHASPDLSCRTSVGQVFEGYMVVNCRRHLNIRGKSANLPAITEKDWLDLQFGIEVGVDYYALSFVRSAEVIYELKAYLAKQSRRSSLISWAAALLGAPVMAAHHVNCPWSQA